MISYMNMGWDMVGLSTDTKPFDDVPNGSTFYEIDTGKTLYFRFDEGWYDKNAEKHLSVLSAATHSGTVYAGYPWATEDPTTNYSVTKKYDDNSTASASGFEVLYPAETTEAGSATTTVVYREGGIKATKDVTVTVTAPALSSITIKTAPTKTTYTAGEKFDPTGLEITATINDSRQTHAVAYADEPDNFTFSPSLTTALATTNTSVTVSYKWKGAGTAKTKSQTITVNAAE